MSRQWEEKTLDKKKKSGKSSVGFRGFVNHELTQADKREFQQYEIMENFEDKLLGDLVDEGYRVSFSLDQHSGAYMAAISTKNKDSVNVGLVLTARSGFGIFQAGLRAAFLHYVVFGEIWPDPQVRGEYVDEWAVPDPE